MCSKSNVLQERWMLTEIISEGWRKEILGMSLQENAEKYVLYRKVSWTYFWPYWELAWVEIRGKSSINWQNMWVFWKKINILPPLEGKTQFFFLCLSFLFFSFTIYTENYISDTSAHRLCGGFPHTKPSLWHKLTLYTWMWYGLR